MSVPACETTAAELIARKRDGGTLSAAELQWLMRGCADGSVSDAQLGAFAMAVQRCGTPREESAAAATPPPSAASARSDGAVA